MGRRLIGDRPLTAAERQQRRRARLRAEHPDSRDEALSRLRAKVEQLQAEVARLTAEAVRPAAAAPPPPQFWEDGALASARERLDAIERRLEPWDAQGKDAVRGARALVDKVESSFRKGLHSIEKKLAALAPGATVATRRRTLTDGRDAS